MSAEESSKPQAEADLDKLLKEILFQAGIPAEEIASAPELPAVVEKEQVDTYARVVGQ